MDGRTDTDYLFQALQRKLYKLLVQVAPRPRTAGCPHSSNEVNSIERHLMRRSAHRRWSAEDREAGATALEIERWFPPQFTGNCTGQRARQTIIRARAVRGTTAASMLPDCDAMHGASSYWASLHLSLQQICPRSMEPLTARIAGAYVARNSFGNLCKTLASGESEVWRPVEKSQKQFLITKHQIRTVGRDLIDDEPDPPSKRTCKAKKETVLKVSQRKTSCGAAD